MIRHDHHVVTGHAPATGVEATAEIGTAVEAIGGIGTGGTADARDAGAPARAAPLLASLVVPTFQTDQ